MEFFELFGFLTILQESIKLLPKNAKLMAFIAIIILVLSSSLLLLFSYSLQSLVFDMSITIMKSLFSDPNSDYDPSDPSSSTAGTGLFLTQIMAQKDHLKLDLALMLALEIAFTLIIFAISLFSILATILVSAASYIGITLSTKELILRMGGSWKRPLITTLYVAGLGLGYLTFVFFLASPLLIYPNIITNSTVVIIGVTSFILYIYLAVIWALAIVISIVEESCYGAKALGKAAAIAKGKRLHGFMLNLYFNLVVFIIFYVGYLRMASSFENATMYALLVLNVSSLLEIFASVAYTVLYFQCKKHHGEEIELHGVIQYAKLPTGLLANAVP